MMKNRVEWLMRWCRPKHATSRDVQLKISTAIARTECFLARASLTGGRFSLLRDLSPSERLL
jgi:hypothetical protein